MNDDKLYRLAKAKADEAYREAYEMQKAAREQVRNMRDLAMQEASDEMKQKARHQRDYIDEIENLIDEYQSELRDLYRHTPQGIDNHAVLKAGIEARFKRKKEEINLKYGKQP